MSRTRTAALAACLLATVVGTFGSAPAGAAPPGAPAPVSSPGGDAAVASPGMLAAMRRDLGLSADQARDRIARESAARRTAADVRRALGDRHAGVWYDAEAGALAVAVTDRAAAERARAAGARPTLVRHDQRHLDRAGAAVAALVGRDHPSGVNGWGTDARANAVVVTLDRTTAPAGLAARLRALDGAVTVVETDSSPRQQGGDVRGGDAWRPGTETNCSIGFAATGPGGSRHFLTAGHCTNDYPTSQAAYGKDGTQLGVSGASTNGATGDYGRVDVTAAGWNLSATVNGYGNGDVMVTGTGDTVVGQSVCRSGQTTQWHCGTVTEVDYSAVYGSLTVNGLVKTDACSEAGDSGGSWVSGSTAVGLHEGGTTNGCHVSTHVAYFQPVGEALAAYGLTLYTGAATPTPTPVPAGCTGYQSSYSGSLTGTTTSQFQPNGTYYQTTVSGTHKACLRGPAGADFDLFLQKWNGSAWTTVATSNGSTSEESVTYTGAAGYYVYKVVADSGTGSYTLAVTKP
ncbi:S1 family peptidase [Longispora sp. NPDC051575]|uniref:S1 family peptidase n=1 Tax=Longispora sp. NPDC051575 TaxID=3154943 RepID=UPI003416140F